MIIDFNAHFLRKRGLSQSDGGVDCPLFPDDLVEQYALYTYPYDVFARIADIKREIDRRSIRGLIHYTQSFCFRQIQDLIIRRHIDIPILTIEGDTPMPLDARTKVRIESFVEMLA